MTPIQDAPSAEAKVPTETIIKALYIVADDIQSDDGVAQSAIRQAARRMEELDAHIRSQEERIAAVESQLQESQARAAAHASNHSQAVQVMNKQRERIAALEALIKDAPVRIRNGMVAHKGEAFRVSTLVLTLPE